MSETAAPFRPPSSPSPIAIGGLGGSGTRLIAQIVSSMGVHIGSDLNRALDNLAFTLLFVRPRWLAEELRSGGRRLGTGLRLFEASMRGRLRPTPAQAAYLAAATADVGRHGFNHRGSGRGWWAVARARAILREGRRPRPDGPWGWKEPATYLLLPHLDRHLPGVRYVHVVRHGLDMAFSRNQQPLAAFGGMFELDPQDRGPANALRFWVVANDWAREEGRAALGDRFVTVNYDDLCLAPRATLERLLDDLGQPVTAPGMDRLASLPSAPASLGMYEREDLSALDPEDVERVREWGFSVSAGRRTATRGASSGRKTRLGVSVALCTYNGDRYLQQQLDSIAAQSRLPDELVVCDDGSTDATLKILSEFAETAPFPIHLHEAGSAPLGPGQNFGRAIGACDGDVIVLCDQDDAWAANRLERVETTFAAQPGLALFFSDADLIDERSRSHQRRLWEALGITPGMYRRFSEGDEVNRVQMMCNGNLVTGATIAMRAEARELVLPVPEGWIHDAWIGLLLSASADVRMSPERTIRYRLHPGQQIGIGVTTLSPLEHLRRRAQLIRRMTKRERPEFRAVARRLTEAEQRLRERRSDRWRVPSKVLTVLSDRAEHFDARGQMDVVDRRWPLVERELAGGRYRRYSNGWLSVAKDALLLDRFASR